MTSRNARRAINAHRQETENRRTEQPRDPASGRVLCTPDRPMPAGAPGRWSHQDVEDIGECSDGCCDIKRCRSCGARWRQESPQ